MKKFYSDIEALCGFTVAGTTSLSTATGITVATSDNSTKLATTAFVKAQGYLTAEVDTLDTVTDRNSVTTNSIGVGTINIIGTTAGAELLTVDGTFGRLFTVTDDLSDSLFSVNTIAGLPVIEVFADNTINLGAFSNPITIDGSSNIVIPGTITASGYNDTNWNTAYNDRIVSAAVSGTTTKTLTLTQTDGGTISTSWTDINTDTDGYISNVSLVGSTLSFTSVGSAFSGIVDLSTLTPTVRTVYETVKNVSGATILKGTPLAVVAGQTSGNVSDVIPADAADPAKMPAIFIANQNIADQAEGEAVLFGNLTGVNTSAYTSGTTVYVAPGGGWTATKPVWPNLIQNLGVITKQHATNGAGIVTGVGRANSLPNLTAGKIWVGSATYPIESTTVHVDEANGRVGIGTTSPSDKLHVNDTSRFVNNTTSSLGGALYTGTKPSSWLFPLETGSTMRQTVIGQATTAGIALPQLNNYGGVGVIGVGGLNTGGRTNIGVFGYQYFAQNMSTNSSNYGYGGYFLAKGIGSCTDFKGEYIGVYGEGNIGTDTVVSTYGSISGGKFVAVGTTNQTTYGVYAQATGGTTNYSIYAPNGNAYFAGNVGIGKTSPDYKLDVDGVVQSKGYIAAGNYDGPASVPNTGIFSTNITFPDGFGSLIVAARPDAARPILFATYNGSAMGERMRITSAGNVGIGTASPGYKLHVSTGNTNVAARLENTTSNGSVLELYSSGDGRLMTLQTDHIYLNAGALHFGAENGALYLRSSGYGTVIGGTTVYSTGGSAALSVIGDVISFGASNGDLSYFRRLSAGKFQWQTYNSGNTGEIHLQPYGGNVGVSTILPAEKFHVVGNVRIDGGSTAAILQTNDATAAEAGTTYRTFTTADHYAVFVDYVVYDAGRSNMRTGTFRAVWTTGDVVYTDVSTVDLGATDNVTLTAAISGANVNLIVTGPADYTLKYSLKVIK